jgi:hypothetical protein
VQHCRRNEPCPCGSGRKYKRCCLRRGGEIALDARAAERAWDRIQRWALDQFDPELGDAMKRHLDARGIGTDTCPANEHDLSLALCWVLIDRELGAGGTPLQRYLQLPDLPACDRELAERIAASRLGLHRVLDSEPGAWIELEDVLDGKRTRVCSPNVSVAAARWQLLLCRVMRGGPSPSLWGAAGFYEPSEERELLDELRRIAAERGLGEGERALREALLVGAGELVCFVPASRHAERVPYTLEGDPVALAEASWRLRDRAAALAALRAAPELSEAAPAEGEDGAEPGEDGAATFDWLGSRRALVARRPPLPPGALVIETGPAWSDEDGGLELGDLTSLGTFTLRHGQLELFCTSEARLRAGIEIVARRLGSLATPPTQHVRPLPPAGSGGGAQHQGEADEEPEALDPRITAVIYRRWLDDSDPQLGGLSPREAAARGEHLNELERLLRGFEFHSARARPDRRPGPEVLWLRAELNANGAQLAA